MMGTDENDSDELINVYGLLCWQSYDKDPGGLEENDVVSNFGRNLLQGVFYMVTVRKDKRRCNYV